MFAFRSHVRFDLYRLWRDTRASRLRCQGQEPGGFAVDGDHDPTRRPRVIEGLIRLLRTEDADLLEGGAITNAARKLRVVQDGRLPISSDLFNSTVRSSERALGTVAISQLHYKRYTFQQDSTPLQTENDLLGMALRLDERLHMGEKHQVDDLAEESGYDTDVVQRILCRWMDDGVAYVPDAALDDDGEPFLLEERARLRFDTWDRYEKDRQRMNAVRILVEVSRPYPNDVRSVIKGIAEEYGFGVSDVVDASKGFTVKAVAPEEWKALQIDDARKQFLQSVRTTLVEIRQHEISSQGTTRVFARFLDWTVDIPYEGRLPLNYSDIAEGAAVQLRAEFISVHPTKQGLVAKLRLPGDWSADDPRREKYKREVLEALEESQMLEMKVSVKHAEPLRPDYKDLIRGLGMKHELTAEGSPTGGEVIVTVTDRSGDQAAFQASVKAFATALEIALSTPATTSTPPPSIAFNGAIFGSAIQAGSPGATQQVRLRVDLDMSKIRQCFADAKRTVAELELDDDTREVIDGSFAMVEKQLGKENPNPKLLLPLLTTVATALTTAGAVGQGLEFVHKLVALLV